MLNGFGKSRSGSSVERLAALIRAEGAVQELQIGGTRVPEWRMHHSSDYVFRWHVEA